MFEIADRLLGALASGNARREEVESSSRLAVDDPARGRMAQRRVVLFGGSGFVGRHLAPHLARHGWTLRVASRSSAAPATTTSPPPTPTPPNPPDRPPAATQPQ